MLSRASPERPTHGFLLVEHAITKRQRASRPNTPVRSRAGAVVEQRCIPSKGHSGHARSQRPGPAEAGESPGASGRPAGGVQVCGSCIGGTWQACCDRASGGPLAAVYVNGQSEGAEARRVRRSGELLGRRSRKETRALVISSFSSSRMRLNSAMGEAPSSTARVREGAPSPRCSTRR